MSILGAHQLSQIGVPTGVDASKVLQFQLQDGTTVEELLAEVSVLIGETNQALAGMYSGLISFTTAQYARYRQGNGVARKTPQVAEYADPDPQVAEKIGHMLPLDIFRDKIQWSYDYLRKANRDDIRDSLMEVMDSWKNRVDLDILTRALTNTERAIGSGGYSVGWAIGTGTNVNYIPPQYMGYPAFTSSHSHYNHVGTGVVSATTLATALSDAVIDLIHHGHTPAINQPLVALVSQTDVTTYRGMTKFVEINPAFVAAVGGNTNSPIYTSTGTTGSLPGQVFGFFNSDYGTVELRFHPRIPTGYGYVTKSYGSLNPRNGIAVRLEDPQRVSGEPYGFGLRPRPQVNNDLSPKLDHILFDASHGVGVNDRTNGVAFYVANGASGYVNPTIS